ncbi:MAG: YncE family protein [Acidimicrobiales bacterium]
MTRRQRLRSLAVAALVALTALTLLPGTAGAADGDISLVAGRYDGQCTLRSPLEGARDLAGEGALAVTFGYNLPGFAARSNGDVYLSDLGWHRIHRISGGLATTVEREVNARTLGVSTSGVVYFVDMLFSGSSSTVRFRALGPSGPTDITTLYSDYSGPGQFDMAVHGQSAFVVGNGEVLRVPLAGGPPVRVLGIAGTGIAVDSEALYVANRSAGTLTKVRRTDGAILATNDELAAPGAVAVNADGTRVFVAQGDIGTVDELDPTTLRHLQTVAGTGTPKSDMTAAAARDGGPGAAAPLGRRIHLAVPNLADVFILDADNCVIRKVANMPKYVPPTTSTSAAPTTSSTIALDRGPPPSLVAPTLPATDPVVQDNPVLGGDLGGQNQALGGAFDPGGGGLGGQFAFDPGGFATASGGNASASPGGASGGPGGPVGPGVPTAQGQPPAPQAGQASGFVPGGQGGPPGNSPAIAGADSDLSRGAPRYAMVAREREGIPAYAPVAAAGLVGLVGCVIGLAARAENRGRPAAQRGCRPRGAY